MFNSTWIKQIQQHNIDTIRTETTTHSIICIIQNFAQFTDYTFNNIYCLSILSIIKAREKGLNYLNTFSDKVAYFHNG